MKFSVRCLSTTGIDIVLGMPLVTIVACKTYLFITSSIFGASGGITGFFVIRSLDKAGLFKYLEERK